MGDRTIYQTSVDLKDCVRESILAAGLPDFCRTCTVPGEIAWDECTGGLLAITTDSIYPSLTFPAEATEDLTSQTSCGPGMTVASYTLAVLRCAPVPKGLQVTAPPCDELEAANELRHLDSYYARRALYCCLQEMADNFHTSGLAEYRVGRDESAGPDGGCVGFTITILAGFSDG